MTAKHTIVKNRIRKIPKQFSWVDHRLVRDRYIEKVSHPAAALYLFLVTVGDANGLSYYGDKSIMKRLSMDQIIRSLAWSLSRGLKELPWGNFLTGEVSSKKLWRRHHD